MAMFDRLVEERIKEAIENGVLEDNPLKGKKLELEEDANVPPELRMSFKVLKDAGLVPEEVALRKDIHSLAALLDACTDDDESRKLRDQLAGARLKYDMLVERRGGRSIPSEYRAEVLRKLGGAPE